MEAEERAKPRELESQEASDGSRVDKDAHPFPEPSRKKTAGAA